MERDITQFNLLPGRDIDVITAVNLGDRTDCIGLQRIKLSARNTQTHHKGAIVFVKQPETFKKIVTAHLSGFHTPADRSLPGHQRQTLGVFSDLSASNLLIFLLRAACALCSFVILKLLGKIIMLWQHLMQFDHIAKNNDGRFFGTLGRFRQCFQGCNHPFLIQT